MNWIELTIQGGPEKMERDTSHNNNVDGIISISACKW